MPCCLDTFPTMCGRFSLSTPADIIARFFNLVAVPKLKPRYNIAPTQDCPVVRFDAETKQCSLDMLHWGLIPSWAKDKAIGNRMINARSESVATKPSFRSAFRRRRCLIVADGFYEWKKLERRKQPYYIRLASAQPFALAGLWEHWEGEGGPPVDSCTIITTEPNELVAPIHNRMPVILRAQNYADWLDPAITDAENTQSLLQPYPPEEMVAFPVSTRVNSPANDVPECVTPAE